MWTIWFAVYQRHDSRPKKCIHLAGSKLNLHLHSFFKNYLGLSCQVWWSLHERQFMWDFTRHSVLRIFNCALSESRIWRYHLELSVFLRANQDLWNSLQLMRWCKARPPAVSPEAPPVANDDEVEVEEHWAVSCFERWLSEESWNILHVIWYFWELIFIE